MTQPFAAPTCSHPATRLEHTVVNIGEMRDGFLSAQAAAITPADYGEYASCTWIGFYLPTKTAVCGGDVLSDVQSELLRVAQHNRQPRQMYTVIGPRSATAA